MWGVVLCLGFWWFFCVGFFLLLLFSFLFCCLVGWQVCGVCLVGLLFVFFSVGFSIFSWNSVCWVLFICMFSFTCPCYQAQTRIYFAYLSPVLFMYDFGNHVHISFQSLFGRHGIITYYTISDISFPQQFLIFSYYLSFLTPCKVDKRKLCF